MWGLSVSGDSGMMTLRYAFNRRNISYSCIKPVFQFNKTILELELFNLIRL